MLPIALRRRTQVVKGEVCKTSMQRFESARRLQYDTAFDLSRRDFLGSEPGIGFSQES